MLPTPIVELHQAIAHVLLLIRGGGFVMQGLGGADFRLRGFVKSGLFTKELAEAIFRAGFRWLLYGFEAANERILVNIDKRAKLANNDRCVAPALCYEHSVRQGLPDFIHRIGQQRVSDGVAAEAAATG